jgi:hypothetical protein
MRTLTLFAALAVLALSGCGEPLQDDHYTNTTQPQVAPAVATQPLGRHQVAVRVGEMGPSFAACSGAGTTRHIAAGKTLAVQEAPLDNAGETGAIPAGQRFFVCTRSHNQKWLGVVYDESGTLAERCGVSAPATNRRDYDGPCKSGWVASPFVRLVAGDAANQAPAAEPKGS